jgi:hypothetical protein
MMEMSRWLSKRAFTGTLAVSFAFASAGHGQARSYVPRIEALNLEVLQVGRVTAYFARDDSARAKHLAVLAESAAAFVQHELGVSFDIRLAALAPKHWFSPYAGDLPYGIPWGSVPERLIVAPSSLKEGALISGRDSSFNARLVDFVTLHEFGHIANKQFFHPASTHEEFPITWFEELLATYFAYAFMSSTDPGWTDLARQFWRAEVTGYTPRVVSLDWGFMRSLPGPELGRTYGWYQVVLNLRVADTYSEHGIAFLRQLRTTLPLDSLDHWTTELLLARLDALAPGFQKWAAHLPGDLRKPENR